MTSRRVGGGSDREAGGAAGARPRAPGGRIVFLRGAAAGVGTATGTLGLPDPTAPGGPDPSSIPLGRLSPLAGAPNTDCEVGAVRGPLLARCALDPTGPDLGASTPQMGRGFREAGGTGRRRLESTFPSARETREVPVRGVPGRRRGSAELGARRVEGAAVEPRLCAVGAGSGHLCRPSFCESCLLDWGARKGII